MVHLSLHIDIIFDELALFYFIKRYDLGVIHVDGVNWNLRLLVFGNGLD